LPANEWIDRGPSERHCLRRFAYRYSPFGKPRSTCGHDTAKIVCAELIRCRLFCSRYCREGHVRCPNHWARPALRLRHRAAGSQRTGLDQRHDRSDHRTDCGPDYGSVPVADGRSDPAGVETAFRLVLPDGIQIGRLYFSSTRFGIARRRFFRRSRAFNRRVRAARRVRPDDQSARGLVESGSHDHAIGGLMGCMIRPDHLT
jgi:hypothetical protein